MMQQDERELSHLIEQSRSMVIFTGAGISTESGIPDFRSPGGFWTKNQPIDFSDFLASEEARRESWRRKFAFDPVLGQAAPNDGHKAIARLFDRGIVSHVITQNIDGLHQLSGIPDDRLIEIHGNTTYAKCLDCEMRIELIEVRKTFEQDETLPVCGRCGGIVKTATISFGQPMPVEEMQAAEAAAMACDLFMVVGSSLVVYPAAGLPLLARQQGAKLVILNRDKTELDVYADLVLNREIGTTLSAVTNL